MADEIEAVLTIGAATAFDAEYEGRPDIVGGSRQVHDEAAWEKVVAKSFRLSGVMD